MDDRVPIAKCKECGGKGIICKSTDNIRRPYYIKCSDCSNKSSYCNHIDTAISSWNEKNHPEKMRPKYICANCGAELYFGFNVCTKCGTEVEW